MPPAPAFAVAQASLPRMSSRESAPRTSLPRRRRLLHYLSRAAVATAASLALHASPVRGAELRAPSAPACEVCVSAPTRPLRATRPRVGSAPALSAEVEAQMLLRMGVAVACGAIIGMERRAASANAGIRTLSLVSLGSAIFSLTSLHGLGGDPSRMGAAISTGIGFLGSGAINGDILGSQRQLVTAASIWIAAALGVAAASGLFGMALWGAIVTVWILRWQLLHRYARRFVQKRVGAIRKLCGWIEQLIKEPVEKKDEAKIRSEYESWKR